MSRTGRSWEQLGAASGLLATALFVAAAVVFMFGADPTGDPALPNVKHAELAPGYLASYLSEIRVVVLLEMLGLALFVWFLGSLWTTLKEAEGAGGRGATLVALGGVAAVVLMLAGLALTATAGLSTSTLQADSVATLYTASSLLIALGGGMLSIFFFGASRVILHTEALGRGLGILAFIAGLLSVCGFMTPFFAADVLNAATGALGRWGWTVAFVLWLGLASLSMTLAQRRTAKAAAVAETTTGGAR